MTAVATRGSTDMASRHASGLQRAVAAAVVSGGAVYVNGEAVGRFPSPTVYTTGKNLVAGVLLVAIAMVVAQHRRQVDAEGDASVSTALEPRQAAGLATVAVVGGAVPFVLFFEGLARATSSDAAFIHKTLVVWVAILAVVVLRERFTLVHLGSVALLIVAQIAVANGVGSLRPGTGEAMILAATLCWSVELIVVKRLVESVQPSMVAASRIGGGAVLLILWLSVTGRFDSLTSLTSTQWAWLALTGSILSIFVSVWFAAVARAQVIDVAAVLVLGAVITGVLDLGAGGAVVPVRVAGWVLMSVTVAVLVTQRAFAERRPGLA